MPDKEFLLYGRLPWIDPETYGDACLEWAFIDTAVALDDGEYYQILAHYERHEMRYTKFLIYCRS